MKTPQLSVQKTAPKSVRLEIYDNIGPSWAGMIDSKSVSAALQSAGDISAIEVRINSPGGDCGEGIGIHNLLKTHPAKVTVIVDGIAASAASLIAMAGDTIRVPKNALMMIHEPWSIAMGAEDDLLKAAEMLATYNRACINTYAEKTGKKPEEIAALLKAETWMTGDEALAAGFATETAPEVKVETASAQAATHELFRRAPAGWNQLVALSVRKETPVTQPTPAPAPENPTVAAVAAAVPGTLTAIPADAVVSAAPKIDVAAEAEKAAAAEHNRATTIMSLCKTAGCPEKAEAYVADRKATPESVRAALFNDLCAKNQPVGDSGSGNPAPKDPTAEWKKEYAAHASIFKDQGISEEDYCKSRALDAA